MKRAIVTGITGQDGSYLAELLLSKGYEVHGIIRRASTFHTQRIDHIYEDPNQPTAKLFLHYGDLSSSEWLLNLIYSYAPDEVYHLAAQSHVRVSFDMPEYTGDITGTGTTRLLEAIRRSGSKTRFCQASCSEMFGSAPPPQSETTSFQPRSPYAVAKVYSYWMTRIYREGHKLFAGNGISTRLGYAPEYVEAIWKMLHQDQADDIVIGTGEPHSVQEFVEETFAYAQRDWEEIRENLGAVFSPPRSE